MFTMKIIDSDSFLDLPLSAQALYFHLNMRADDDGFVGNPKKIMKMIGASEDELKLLLIKRFVIGFESGVIVIKHWRMHNTLKCDRYHPTSYQEEFAKLRLKTNKSYTDTCPGVHQSQAADEDDSETKMEPNWNQNETKIEQGRNQNDTTDLDVDVEIGEDAEEAKEPAANNEGNVITKQFAIESIIAQWNSLSAYGIPKIRSMDKKSPRYKYLSARLDEYGFDTVIEAIRIVEQSPFLRGENDRGWTITFDWFIGKSNFVKILEGNYLPKKHKAKQRRDDLDDIM